jgi:hypothetical protein
MVVLPFANLGGDPEEEYFVDGVTESLTTDLSRISGAFVIARNTAFTYKGKPHDVKQIGRELNVRYVLEGSIQRIGSRMRVNVQGPSVSISQSRTCSTYRMKSSRGLPAHSTLNLSQQRHVARSKHQVQTRWTYVSKGWLT